MVKPGHLDNRIEFIKKMDQNGEYESTEEELESAYGYLDTCLSCDKRFRFGESFSHGFAGNVHRFGCSILARGFGYLYQIIKLITIPIWFPIILLLSFIGWLIERMEKGEY